MFNLTVLAVVFHKTTAGTAFKVSFACKTISTIVWIKTRKKNTPHYKLVLLYKYMGQKGYTQAYHLYSMGRLRDTAGHFH